MCKQFGMSLIELMISITLGLILMNGVVQIFISSKQVYSTQQGMSGIQQAGRIAVDFMANDLRSAGYRGCSRNTFDVLPGTLTDDIGGAYSANSTIIGVMGYDDSPAAVTVKLGVAPIANNSVLVIHTANQVGRIINAATSPTTLTAYIPSTVTKDAATNCVGDLCEGKVAVISDCLNSIAFKISTLTAAANTLTVTHDTSWGAANNLTQNFTTGAELLRLNTIVYFLALGSDGVTTNLYKKINSDPALEMLEGIEKMNITYAPSSNGVLGTYKSATDMTAAEWPNVLAARIELVVRSKESTILSEAQPYTYKGVTQTPVSTDRAMRQIFTTTVSLRTPAQINN